jgi:hypothetical protein
MIDENNKTDAVPTSVASNILGLSVSTTLRLVDTGDLTPLAKLPGKRGGYLFDATAVEALRVKRASIGSATAAESEAASA